MYSCPLHQWNSYESPCPSCATTVTTGGDLPLQIVVPATPSVNDPSVQILIDALQTIDAFDDNQSGNTARKALREYRELLNQSK